MPDLMTAAIFSSLIASIIHDNTKNYWKKLKTLLRKKLKEDDPLLSILDSYEKSPNINSYQNLIEDIVSENKMILQDNEILKLTHEIEKELTKQGNLSISLSGNNNIAVGNSTIISGDFNSVEK